MLRQPRQKYHQLLSFPKGSAHKRSRIFNARGHLLLLLFCFLRLPAACLRKDIHSAGKPQLLLADAEDLSQLSFPLLLAGSKQSVFLSHRQAPPAAFQAFPDRRLQTFRVRIPGCLFFPGAGCRALCFGSRKAGLQVNDIITAIDDTAVDSPSALTAALSTDYKAGDTAVLTVIRNQQEIQLTVTLDEKNAETEAANPIQQQNQQSQQGSGGSGYYQWPFGSFFW